MTPRSNPDTSGFARLKVAIRGAVQGVGFRPFVYRLAKELGLSGWVNNSTQGVFIEVEGAATILQTFLFRLQSEKPPRSYIQSLEASWLDPRDYTDFEIRESDSTGAKTTLVLPDIATCPDCLNEIFDPTNRRYRYPFTNCTHCGPRFSIIEALPYDRPNTSMQGFSLCAECQAEYKNPNDRRFHAQPNACPVCGPQLELWDHQGQCILGVSDRESGTGTDPNKSSNCLERSYPALKAAAQAIREGRIVAVKGLGGFHLIVAAHDDDAVRRLRERKHREEKPLATLFPSLDEIKKVCEVSALEERLLNSPEAPIVLLRRFVTSSALADPSSPVAPSAIAASVAPGNPYLGVMLPYTPLHHLLMAELGIPVVATSGNLSDEPICIDEKEAVERLGGIADLFLAHNRPIIRQVDDSIVRVMMGREMVLRRARGYAPLPLSMAPYSGEPDKVPSAKGQASLDTHPPPSSILAVGAHLKNAVALSVGTQAFISQHIGDLETEPAFSAFRHVIEDLARLYEANPDWIVSDRHPDYLSTQYARDYATRGKNRRHLTVQHHLAHVFACMAENELSPPFLGVSWDGTGHGLDGTVWGGEFFRITTDTEDRVASFRPFRLPGGDQAVKEPRRSALGLLFELGGAERIEDDFPKLSEAFSQTERTNLVTMLEKQLNAPLTSSVGRLFDVVSALVCQHHRARFEGQAAMELEFALPPKSFDESYPISLISPTPLGNVPIALPASGAPPMRVDWAPMIEAILAEARQGVAIGLISARFHNALAESIVQVAKWAGVSRVVLSGGCFQNRYLTERAVRRLREEGFLPYWHQRVPPNDGGIALGQLVAVMREKV